MAKFVITHPGASKEYKLGKHSYYEVGETVELESLPASLKGKAKEIKDTVEEVKSTKSSKK